MDGFCDDDDCRKRISVPYPSCNKQILPCSAFLNVYRIFMLYDFPFNYSCPLDEVNFGTNVTFIKRAKISQLVSSDEFRRSNPSAQSVYLSAA